MNKKAGIVQPSSRPSWNLDSKIAKWRVVKTSIRAYKVCKNGQASDSRDHYGYLVLAFVFIAINNPLCRINAQFKAFFT
jgi:hypothetical protein